MESVVKRTIKSSYCCMHQEGRGKSLFTITQKKYSVVKIKILTRFMRRF